LIERTSIFTAMYTVIKIPLHFKNCYLHKCIRWLTILKLILS